MFVPFSVTGYRSSFWSYVFSLWLQAFNVHKTRMRLPAHSRQKGASLLFLSSGHMYNRIDRRSMLLWFEFLKSAWTIKRVCSLSSEIMERSLCITRGNIQEGKLLSSMEYLLIQCCFQWKHFFYCSFILSCPYYRQEVIAWRIFWMRRHGQWLSQSPMDYFSRYPCVYCAGMEAAQGEWSQLSPYIVCYCSYFTAFRIIQAALSFLCYG